MSVHVFDDLPRLLTGDASREEVVAAAKHLRVCPDCQQELVSAVVAHASLISAYRIAPQIVVGESSVDEQDAPPLSSLPDMSEVFATVRREAERPRRHTRLLIAAACAAVVIAGGGITIAETLGSSSPHSTSIALHVFEYGTHGATATLVSDHTMRINASALPTLDASHLYEVWLTNQARTKMRSVGFLGNNNQALLTAPATITAQYSDIEISVQRTDQSKYSGVSVVRGAYR